MHAGHRWALVSSRRRHWAQSIAVSTSSRHGSTASPALVLDVRAAPPVGRIAVGSWLHAAPSAVMLDARTADAGVVTREEKNRWLDRQTSVYDFAVTMADHRTRRSTHDTNRCSRVCGRGRGAL